MYEEHFPVLEQKCTRMTVIVLPKSVSVDWCEYGGGDLSSLWFDAAAAAACDVNTRSSSIHSSLSRKSSTSLKMCCNIAEYSLQSPKRQ